MSPEFPASLLASLSVFGIIGNLNVLWASIRKPSMRSSCNILIAATALADVAHQFGHIILVGYMYTGHYTVELRECYWVQFVSMFGANFGSVMLLIVGCDRLWCVAKPGSYRDMRDRTRLTIMFAFATFVSASINFLAYLNMVEDPADRVVCSLVEGFHNEAKLAFTALNGLWNLLATFVYSAIWITVRRVNYSGSKQMLRSITMVTVFVVGGWLLTMLSFGVCMTLGLDKDFLETTALLLGVFVNLSLCVNLPIYYIMSKDYRVAFVEQVAILSCNRIRMDVSFSSSSAARSSIPPTSIKVVPVYSPSF